MEKQEFASFNVYFFQPVFTFGVDISIYFWEIQNWEFVFSIYLQLGKEIVFEKFKTWRIFAMRDSKWVSVKNVLYELRGCEAKSLKNGIPTLCKG